MKVCSLISDAARQPAAQRSYVQTNMDFRSIAYFLQRIIWWLGLKACQYDITGQYTHHQFRRSQLSLWAVERMPAQRSQTLSIWSFDSSRQPPSRDNRSDTTAVSFWRKSHLCKPSNVCLLPAVLSNGRAGEVVLDGFITRSAASDKTQDSDDDDDDDDVTACSVTHIIHPKFPCWTPRTLSYSFLHVRVEDVRCVIDSVTSLEDPRTPI